MKKRVFLLLLIIPLLSSLYANRIATVKAGAIGGESAVEPADAANNKLLWSVPLPGAASPAQAEVRSGTGTIIEFRTQNGLEIQGRLPLTKSIPHLVLYRNGEPTPPEERTLIFELSDLPQLTDVVTLTIDIETQHPDPNLGSGSQAAIPVYRESYRIDPAHLSAGSIVLTHTFDAVLNTDMRSIPTPTDYLRLGMVLTDNDHPIEDPIFAHIEEYAILLENQWVHTLTGLDEEANGAAPDELIIYSCDMFPFQKDPFAESSRIARGSVTGYIRDELAPAMLEAVRMQTNDWGFAWHPAWTSYRGGEDSERISVALTMPGVWYHGRAPGSAHSGISINTMSKDYADYQKLTDGLMSAFHHELFHNIQRNIHMKAGGDVAIDGPNDEWAYFTEGMAIMASSVGQPGVEYTAAGAYMRQANAFISGDKFHSDDLNTRFDELDPYRAGLYWRFLYEVCGGAGNGSSSAVGMGIIQHALESLYSASSFTGEETKSLVEMLPDVMDNALANTLSCPMRTYNESIALFARYVYTLKLHTEECAGAKALVGCGFYDPEDLYLEPPAEAVAYGGAESAYAGDLPGSYGMDFVEVNLDADMPNRPSMIEFQAPPETASVFDVQVFKWDRPGDDRGSEISLVAEEMVGGSSEAGTSFRMPLAKVYQEEGERWVLIITRVDADEVVDPAGAYSVSLR